MVAEDLRGGVQRTDIGSRRDGDADAGVDHDVDAYILWGGVDDGVYK